MNLGAANMPTTPPDLEKNQKIASLIRRLAELSIKGSGDRLVLGEQDAAIMDALDKGGKFIDLGTEAEQMLQQSRIDPYVIHVAALMLEMQNKISAIELAGTNVDQLLQAWRGKSADRAPIHVRQALWLQDNASRYGYEKRGNGWKLKR
jgi:hypothetical protein